ncbi:MAG: methyl-accepting chemotaxis protein [Candidatus Thiodiazotropha sp.]
MLKQLSIKTIPLAMTSSVIILMTLFFYLLSQHLLNLQTKEYAKLLGSSKTPLWNTSAESYFDRMTRAGDQISEDFSLKTAIKQNNIDDILRLSKLQYDFFTNDLSLVDLWILGPDGKRRSSINNLEFSASSHDRLTERVSSLETNHGMFELNNGSVSPVLIQPIKKRKGITGYVVLIGDTTNILHQLKKLDGDDYLFIAPNGSITANTMEPVLDIMLPDARADEISFSNLQVNNKSYTLTFIPLNDSNEAVYAYLVNQRDETDLSRNLTNAFYTGLGLSLTVMIVMFIMTVFSTRKTLNPLTELVTAIGKIAKGDLTASTPFMITRELSTLEGSTKAMISNLRDLVMQIAHSSDILRTEANNVLQMSEQTENGMIFQAQKTSQVDQAMTELSSSIEGLARNTGDSSKASDDVRNEAVRGQTVIAEADQHMQKLGDVIGTVELSIIKVESTSQEMGDVLNVLNGISDQTNLLALNAAIESARAGEMGRGFAVVADEVRSLAVRAQQSTAEIRDRIDELRNSTQHAVEMITVGRTETDLSIQKVEKAEQSLSEILNAVNAIVDRNLAVSSTAEEQSATVLEVKNNTQSIRELTDTSVENASRLRESAKKVSSLAEQLEKQIERFSL